LPFSFLSLPFPPFLFLLNPLHLHLLPLGYPLESRILLFLPRLFSLLFLLHSFRSFFRSPFRFLLEPVFFLLLLQGSLSFLFAFLFLGLFGGFLFGFAAFFLDFFQQFLLAFAGYFFSVGGEDALFEHACSKDVEHTTTFFHSSFLSNCGVLGC
jgi:hypothetical protein